VDEDGLHGEGILHGGDDAQTATTTAGTGEDIEIVHAAHQRSQRPHAPGAGVAAGAEIDLMCVRPGAGRPASMRGHREDQVGLQRRID
jgi:hypothetical protein